MQTVAMHMIDISWPVSPTMTGYKDADVCSFTPQRSFEQDGVRLTELRLQSHMGTHVDAPSHFLADGVSIDQIPLQRLCGLCIVVDATGCGNPITKDCLERLLEQDQVEDQIIVLKTSNSQRGPDESFDYSFVYLARDAAQWLVDRGIRAIGVDYLGIERNQPGHPTHRAFLECGIPIIEGLRLTHVQSGRYTLMCLPLPVVGIDGAPARAVLLPPS